MILKRKIFCLKLSTIIWKAKQVLCLEKWQTAKKGESARGGLNMRTFPTKFNTSNNWFQRSDGMGRGRLGLDFFFSFFVQEKTDENFHPALTCLALPLCAGHRRTGFTDVIYILPHPAAPASIRKDPSALLTQATEQRASVPRLFCVPAAQSHTPCPFPTDRGIDSPHAAWLAACEPAVAALLTHPQQLVMSWGTAFLSHRWIKEDSWVVNPNGRMRGQLGLRCAVICEGYK